MKRIGSLFWWTCWVLFLVVRPGYAQLAADLSNEVKESIHRRVDNGYNVGIVLGIINADGMRYYSYGSATASGDVALDAHSVFEIGSITKVFTAVLLADMAERGEVALDDPISRYLPDSVTVPARGEQPITLAHLSTHTSGLPRLPTNFAPANPQNPYADYTVAQLYDFLSNYTLPRDVGAEYEYSNVGVGLLGHLLARRAGMSYEALVKERILDVLGLDETGITLTPDMQSRFARGHAGILPVPNWDLPTLAGAGALRSTAHDMLRFLAANMGLEASPLSEAMQQTHQARVHGVTGGMDVGLGWHIRPHGDDATIWHNGGTGGYRSFIGFLKDGSRGVVVLTNSAESVDDLGFHMLDPTFPLRTFREEATVAPEILETYVGRYELTPAFHIDITREADQLSLQATGQPRFPIFPTSETAFFLKVVDAQITFNRNEAGEVESLTLHQNGQDVTGKKVE